MKCPECGRFVSQAVAWVNVFEDRIHQVQAQCSKHGTVEPQDWEADDFDTSSTCEDPSDG